MLRSVLDSRIILWLAPPCTVRLSNPSFNSGSGRCPAATARSRAASDIRSCARKPCDRCSATRIASANPKVAAWRTEVLSSECAAWACAIDALIRPTTKMPTAGATKENIKPLQRQRTGAAADTASDAAHTLHRPDSQGFSWWWAGARRRPQQGAPRRGRIEQGQIGTRTLRVACPLAAAWRRTWPGNLGLSCKPARSVNTCPFRCSSLMPKRLLGCQSRSLRSEPSSSASEAPSDRERLAPTSLPNSVGKTTER